MGAQRKGPKPPSLNQREAGVSGYSGITSGFGSLSGKLFGFFEGVREA